MKRRGVLFLWAALGAGHAIGDTIRVPADHADIQAALDAARGSDTVLVAPGEYLITEPLSFNRLHDPADPGSPRLKDLLLLSEAGPEATTIRMVMPLDAGRASVIVFEKGETVASHVEGFTITGGAGTMIAGQAAGGGVFLLRSSCTLKDCIIRGNAASQRGIGGGFYCENSSPKLEGCSIAENFSEERGGGLEARNAYPILTDSRILGNWTRGTAGGMYSSTTSASQLRQCVIAGNAASFAGALQVNGRIIFDHCTVTANSASNSGGGAVCQSSSGVFITNSIFWRNDPPASPQSSCDPTYSLEDEDPLFVQSPEVNPLQLKRSVVAGEERDMPDFFAVKGDYRLKAGSLAIDRGDPAFPKDADGTRTDLGAFAFFQENPRAPGRWTVDLAGGGDFTAIQPALDASIDGDEIIVKPGVYEVERPITYRSRMVTLRSEAGPLSTIIRRSPPPVDPETGSVCVFESRETENAVLEGFTLNGGDATRGGGILVASATPAIRNCRVTGNRAVDGGGVALFGKGTLTDCVISRNVALRGGGLRGGGAVTGCRISGNFAEDGGGVHISGTSTFVGCVITENVARARGGAAFISSRSSPSFEACTLSGNVAGEADGGLSLTDRGTTLTGCIVWNNLGVPTSMGNPSSIAITLSCVEGDGRWPGTGNIHQDPLFVGWTVAGPVYVDPAAVDPGDGSLQAPYRDLRDGLEGYSLLLAEGSPCLGTGGNGSNMGADGGQGLPAGERRPIVKLAPGTFPLEGATFAHFVSLEGSGADRTELQGTVLGLRSGCSLEGVTVAAAPWCAIVALPGETALVRRSTIRPLQGSLSSGVLCHVGSRIVLEECLLTGWREGAVAFRGSSLVMDRCAVSGNGDPERSRTAILLEGSTAVVKGCDISENLAVALGAHSNVTVENTRVTDNGGPGLVAQGATVVISSSSFVRNSGIECTDSDVRILTSSILSNVGPGVTTRGSSLSIDGCTIAGNETIFLGGGVRASGSGDVSIVNTLIAGNYALEKGGGLALEGSGRHSLLNCTIHGNTVSSSARADPLTSAAPASRATARAPSASAAARMNSRGARAPASATTSRAESMRVRSDWAVIGS
jgi:hypothetical protein